jgi:hypothetical protein
VTAALIAVAGILGTLIAAVLSPWLQANRSAKHARDAHIYDLRVELYAKAVLHAETRQELIQRLVRPDQYGTRTPEDLPPTDHQLMVTAQMRLLASQDVLEAWLHLQEAKDVLLHLIHGEWKIGHEPRRKISSNVSEVAAVTAAIKEFRNAIRKDLQGDNRVT